jgi:hypothetical protein
VPEEKRFHFVEPPTQLLRIIELQSVITVHQFLREFSLQRLKLSGQLHQSGTIAAEFFQVAGKHCQRPREV